jgi:soluble lytic murein transglycosylase-like protein
MIINTMSEGISLAKKLETDSAGYYERMARQYPENAETWLAYAKENKKNFVQIERAYFGVITDAIEGCYALNLETDKYSIDTNLPANLASQAALKKAIVIETRIISYLTDSAAQSSALMADVPRTFIIVSKKHNNRIASLTTMLGK